MLNEAQWEQIALEQFAGQGWRPLHGTDIAPGADRGRETWTDIALPARMLMAMRDLNPDVPDGYVEQALAEILSPTSQDAITENRRIHGVLVDGYNAISYVDAEGIEQSPTIRLVSHREEDNEFLVVNQVTVRSTDHERRFDVVLYLNGMPVIVIELKNAGDPNATLSKAHGQLATYLDEFPTAFRFCVLTVVSDGLTARYGTPFTPLNHYSPWNVGEDGEPLDTTTDVDDQSLGVELEYLADGIGNPERFLQLLRNFVAFDAGAGGYQKRVAKPHQYFAVTKAVGTTVDAARSNGKGGVVWHTQGSGKSMEMELYAHLVAHHPALKNPTLVVVTDRTELDTQLFDTFQRSELLGESPVQVNTRDELRTRLGEKNTGGIFFTTLQKFGLTEAERKAGRDHPTLSDRPNVVVIVDEAHRSHYEKTYGFARHIRQALPRATFIAFTGTPLSMAGRDTVEVFGDVIDTYDLTRAVDDGATVPVRFAPRLIGVQRALAEEELDRAADEATAGLDDVERDRVERSVAVINAVYGAPERLKTLARDLVDHWAHRSDAMRPYLSAEDVSSPGKALVVCGTREICARLYDEIVALRPDWHDDAIDRGVIKVVYSGSASDQQPVKAHVRREGQNKAIKNRLKDAEDPLQIVIVKDMLLTGFDAPPLHTLYLDRPLKGALLMQTLARVNRTFRGKQDGLLVGYAPLIDNLTSALAQYTATDQERRPVGRDVEEAVALVRELIGRIDSLCAGYPWRTMWDRSDASLVKAAAGLTNHLRSPSTPGNRPGEGEETLARRFRRLTGELARGWALAGDDLADLRDEVLFYGEVRVWMAKLDAQERQAAGEPVPEEIARLLSGLVASSTATGDIVDIYAAAGLPTPTLSNLGPDFLAKAQEADQTHLAIEALRNLLTAESAKVARHNLVRQRAFSERISDLMNRYTNEQLTSAEVIARLVELANEVAAEDDRGKSFDPPLSEDELAFYDAVSTNESAVDVQGPDVLAQIARELVAVMQRDVKTDWTVRDDVRAKLRSSIKRLLVKYRYPPDKQPGAIRLVIDQMESMAPRYAA
ncbi:type I restriction endonuclease subunit R [Pseudonocardia endophytica]|uniref:Type I restriction enzyme endonuclease subunit n=1 Tax=Pseudonocardia endophytica TaxID=401976 RepID=A0A4V2PHS6_PSEEN|nr:type I restriction endonuclease subunit R [Pseudonocardia endophytica]TCK21946.1 type I restriction enzyme R subunit [Pseudonocardia endophytica]